jgi:hypothetical protein
MDYELTNRILLAGTYIVYAIWTILIVVLLVALFKRNWTQVKRILKYTLNSIVFIIAWIFIVELALIVRPAFYETKEASSIALKSWIKSYQINDIYFALTTIVILFVINLLLHFKVEKRAYNKDLIVLIVFDAVVLFVGIWLTGQIAYYGLMQEINRHFG